jgi:hypothetical protein
MSYKPEEANSIAIGRVVSFGAPEGECRFFWFYLDIIRVKTKVYNFIIIYFTIIISRRLSALSVKFFS